MNSQFKDCLKMLGLILIAMGIYSGAELFFYEFDGPKWINLTLYISILGLGLYFGLRGGGGPSYGTARKSDGATGLGGTIGGGGVPGGGGSSGGDCGGSGDGGC